MSTRPNLEIGMSLCCREIERQKRTNGKHLHTYIYSYIRTYSMLISILFSLQEHADSMYVCMAVSLIGWPVGSVHGCLQWASSGGGDPPGPFRGQGGQVQGTRKH
jgi:hypothetical protein